ncbi:MAG: fatty acyl-AMP ligase [Gammaproteobacteria bacterium]|nr:fatty acyl-AMP ligase [Gammaproteobacteria bacterium]
MGDFETLTDALEYAATGDTGYNFYDARGNLKSVLGYSKLQQAAKLTARRLMGLGLQRGDKVAIIADTTPEFITLFFACRYAGIVPFAMPVPVNLGSHDIYVKQLNGMMSVGNASAAIANKEYITFLEEAVEGVDTIRWAGTPETLSEIPESDQDLIKNQQGEVAYLQFTSGSTRAPQGVIVTEHAVMSNLRGIVRDGLRMYENDRCASWLPFYHDMGLIGLVLSPLVSQMSVDFLRTRDFAVRPIQWLRLISRNKCTIAFCPPFGLELCAMRVRAADLEGLDLSSWRAAGIGAEMINPQILKAFAERFKPVGFNPDAFLPCYGLAEASLAVSFSEVGGGVELMKVDTEALADRGMAVQVESDSRKSNEFVNCGKALPGHEVIVVNDSGDKLPDLRVGRVLLKGPSIMSGYINDHEATESVMKPNGWMDTGDLGFLSAGNLYLTGRHKDIIIINGRNIRSQDIEEIAEQQPEIRTRETSAFSVTDSKGKSTVVLVIENRLSSVEERQALKSRIQRLVYNAFGVKCFVELVPPHTLPRTSSGKLSRAAACKGFLERTGFSDPKSAQADSFH